MTNRNILRDFVVYSITSIRYLLFKGYLNLFLQDMAKFQQWRMYRVSSKGTLDYRIPWLVFSSISFLESWVKKNMQVFEYGSGGSTLYFAEKTEHVISVEHDKSWYDHAKKVILDRGVGNIHYTLLEPQPLTDSMERNCADPQQYVSCFKEYKGYEFSAYANAITHYPDDSFDLVVIDGRVRHSCIAHAMQKVKKNGALLLDNADRAYYLKPFPQLHEQDKWKLVNFIGHFPYGPASVVNTTKLFIKIA
ncbi:O-methyltransferase [Lacibacter sediminis]|uniref:Class I SAM-dependent methyltransferase n=1 Tax=Lacibacter sediminis TaxID=2760713 RepID=A0A7G5XHQ7_9BACT|nr:hypothetical protein [Lacibacter sediminis]QNA45010.1 hypothetical protein H4075_02105 [Lacibacter sediminis]